MSSGQLVPLVALRWRMVRSARARLGFGLLAASVPSLCALAVVVGSVTTQRRGFDVLLLAPTAYLSVAVLAVLAPLVAGGGNELFPPDHLSAYPVTARTQFVASLALTPLNLAWTTQLVGLLGLTAYVTPTTWWLPLSVALCLLYVGLVTVGGQAFAWLVIGIRARKAGRQATWLLAGAVVTVALVVTVAGGLPGLLDAAPTTPVVTAATNSSAGFSGDYWQAAGALAALAVLAFSTGTRACAWALRRPGDAATRIDARRVERRRQRKTARHELLVTDRASVWRSPSLRRGLLVLGVLPGLVAAIAGLEWSSLVLLPGLVAAGAGLLFGVNAFCLDGAGSIWLATLPGSPSAPFWSKTQVVAETCAVAIVITLGAGSMSAGRLPTSAEVVALAACAVVAVVRVVTTCMEFSVHRPHRADLRGPRDTPAPPGVMAAYSARLAVSTTLVAVLFSTLAEAADWRWSVLIAVPLVLFAARRLIRLADEWRDAAVRSRVVTTVASG